VEDLLVLIETYEYVNFVHLMLNLNVIYCYAVHSIEIFLNNSTCIYFPVLINLLDFCPQISAAKSLTCILCYAAEKVIAAF
jgi:hypothetical protein